MSMVGHLDEREDRLRADALKGDRDRAAREWMDQGTAPEVRLLKFDRWIRLELKTRINWAWAGPQVDRRIEQCRIQLDSLVLALWQRGWMLDGQRLAKHIQAALDDIAAAQRAGRIRDFWPFYKGVVNRYVGLNSEEIQREAISSESAFGDVFNQLKKKVPALPELIAERRDGTIRERLTKARKAEARKLAEKGQKQLF